MKALLICLLLVTISSGLVALNGFSLLDGIKGLLKRAGFTKKSSAGLALVPAIFLFASFFCSRIYREVLIFLWAGIIIFIGMAYLRYVNVKLSRYLSKVFLIIVIGEAVLFNMPAYHLWLGDYSERELPLSEADIEGKGTFKLSDDKKSLTVLNDKELLLYYTDINEPVGTISAQVEFDDDCFVVDMDVDITDETHATYRYDAVSQKIYKFEPDSGITVCHLSGDVGKLRIKFAAEQENTAYTISDIRINKSIPFSVSPVRMLIFLGLAVLIYALSSSMFFDRRLSACEKDFAFISCITGIMAVFAICIMVASKLDISNGLFSVLFKETGDQMTKELVDAFEAGQISLLTKPGKDILSLSNPYDWGLRELGDVDYLWDHVLYNGKYYSYYGIAPVILLYLPFHLLTGYYFPTNLSVMLFAAIGMIFLIKTYMLIAKMFKNISLSVACAGELVLVFSCGIFYAVGRPKFYEAAVSAGFMFLTMGTYMMFSSGLLDTGRTDRVRLLLSSLFLALAVLSRPTMAVYCICACVFFLFGFLREQRENKSKGKLSYWLCALLPMAVLGLVQMVYNYLRFDSPFDFGIGYSLTINDFTRVSYHTIYVLILLYNYIFAPVKFSAEYPIISADFNRLSVNGYFFKDTGNTPGLIFVALPVLAYLLAGKALKSLPKKKRGEAVILLGLPCILMPFVTIFAAWNSGYAARYLADFSWEVVIGALVIIFFLCNECKDKVKLSYAKWLMCFCAVWSIVVNTVNVFNFCFKSSSYPYMAYELEQFFSFWK